MSTDRRETHYEEERVAQDRQELAEAEARNGLLQYDYAVQVIMEAIERKAFRLRPPLLLSLHREALQHISHGAGTWRSGPVKISGSGHEPVPASRVAEEIEVLCDYVNDRWEQSSALHLSAYVMWRLNWIHPFTDGNGRTSRMISYVVLSIKIRSVLPGTPTTPDQIVGNRVPYFTALEAADEAWAHLGIVDVSKMEELLGALLAHQLVNAHAAATTDALQHQKRPDQTDAV